MRPLYDLANMFAAQIHLAEQEGSKCYEPLVGIVTDNKDPQKLGRVKIKFPVLSDRDTSWWSPIVMLGAGKNRGWFFIPEVDDEVLCLFEHGDLDRPVVIGALWNGKDKPADKNPGGNPRRVIRSRQGSKIIFDDEKNKLIIEDGTGKGRITFEADGNKILIEAIEGDVCFQSPAGDMTIVAKTVELTAKSNVEIHAGQKMQWGTSASATISGSGGVTMSGAKVNINCGVAQMPPKPEANPQDVPDPYEARGQHSSGGGAGGAGGGPTPDPTLPPSPPQNPPPPALQPRAEAPPPPPPPAQPQKKVDPENVHVVSIEMKTPGGEPLAFEEVILVKKSTGEKVAGPVTTDENGNVALMVDEEGDYELQIVHDDMNEDYDPPRDEEVEFQLQCVFEDDGVPLAGETVKVAGSGFNGSVTLDAGGRFEMEVAPGEYELTIKGQTFHAVAVRKADLAGVHAFQIDNKLDNTADFEKARANRFSPSGNS